MPVEYKTKDAVESYRNYYMSEEKQKIASWKKGREKPSWYRVKGEVDGKEKKKVKLRIIRSD
jgi:hypothetical protein